MVRIYGQVDKHTGDKKNMVHLPPIFYLHLILGWGLYLYRPC